MDPTPQNLQLDRPRLLLAETSTLRKWSFYAVLLALGGLGAWGSFITAFELPVSPAALAVVGAGFGSFTLWRQVDTRKRWWSVSLFGWILWLLALVFLFDQCLHGAVRTVNTMLDFYSNKLNYDLPMLTLNYSPGQSKPNPEEECTVFFCLSFYPFFWAMSRMMVRRRSTLGPFSLTGVLLVFPLSFSILPAQWAFGLLLMFWCALLLISSLLEGHEGLLGRHAHYKASGVASAQPGTLLVLPLLLFAMVGLYAFCSPETYTRPRLADQLRAVVEEGVGANAYLQGGQGNSNRQVQLNKLGSRSYTGEPALRVKFEWEQTGPYFQVQSKEYLKSFVGSVYTGVSWQRLEPEARAQLEELELQAQNQVSLYSRDAHVDNFDASARYTLSVENLGANPRCVFTPCGLSGAPAELAAFDLEFVDDGFVKSSNFLTGTRNYTLEAVGQGTGVNYYSRVVNLFSIGRINLGRADYSGSELKYSSLSLENIRYESYSPDLKKMIEAWNLFTDDLKAQSEQGGPGWQPDLWTCTPELRSGTAGQALPAPEFLDMMEAYNQFVYEHYTQVPEGLQDFLASYRAALDLDPYDRRRRTFENRDGAIYFANRIAEVFSEYYTYSLAPPAPSAGQDFVEFFLNDSREGYCVHFASAAVLLLRSAGYPARYAEGYAVPCSDSGSWVEVPDYNAHAWVEVYCGGMGWIPVEVTPASVDNPASYYNAALPTEGGETVAVRQPTEPTPTLPPFDRVPLDHDDLLPTFSPRSTPTPAPSEGQGPGSGKDSAQRVWLGVLVTTALLAVLAVGLWLHRKWQLSRWEKALAQPDRSAAALRAYALLLKLYDWQALCGRRDSPPERWKEIAEKARYSNHMVTGDELGELTTDAARLKEKLRTQLPWRHKLRCWLAGLI